MTDLATLGLRVESQEVAVADDRLDDLTAASLRAESATDRLAAAARGQGAAQMVANTAMVQQRRQLDAVRHATGLTTQEGLNLSRQFADIGVTAAMGMNPLMILIQQGPQIADTFQTAAMRGVTFRMVLDSIYARLAPLLAVLGPIVLAVGAVGAGFGLAARSMSRDAGDLTNSLGLTEDQLKKLKESGEDTTITLGDSFRGFGTAVKEVLAEAFGPQIDAAGSAWNSFLNDLTTNTGKEIKSILGFFIGAYNAVTTTWSMLPAALGDAAVQAANATITALNWMIAKSVEGINSLRRSYNDLPEWARGGQTAPMLGAPMQFDAMANPYAGGLDAINGAEEAAYARGQAQADAMVDGFNRRWAAATRRSAADRIREAAGDPKDGSRGGKTDAEREVERIEKYVQSLKDQAATLGLSAIAAKDYEITQRAAAAAQYGLSDAVRAAGDALLTKMRIEAADMDGKSDAMAMLRLEASLIGATNERRAVEIAQLVERQRLLAAGVKETDAEFAPAVSGAGDIARQTEQNRVAQDLYNDSLRLTLDLARQIDDHARDAATGLAEAFGEQGRAVGELLTVMTGYQSRLAEINEAQERMSREGALSAERQAMFERDRAQATVGAYGDMISAARGYFAEGSDGYRALLVAEQIYRAFQFASSIQAMAQGGIETATSIAQSGAKGLASMAAGAAKMFEFLGPLGFPAVAAMLGLLAGLGLAGSGGGKGSGGSSAAANDNDPSATTDAVRATNTRDAQGRDAAAAATASKIEVRVTADRDGLNAYVVQTARDQAVSVAAPMVAAGSAGTKRGVMEDLQSRQLGNRRITV